uniref:Uncharacterized protein n=1 Tax=Moniliophthora roreri TaxID=221103 RepID=A0A0W0G1R7_MONRR
MLVAARTSKAFTSPKVLAFGPELQLPLSSWSSLLDIMLPTFGQAIPRGFRWSPWDPTA